MRRVFANFLWPYSGSIESMVVADGLVEWRGPVYEAPQPTEGLGWLNLQGQAILPGFVDSHCHILPTGLDFQKLHLSGCTTREDVVARVRQKHAELPEGEWLHAVHYDQTRFDDGFHLTAAELDLVSEDRPILLRHVNGHASVANSAALGAARIDPAVVDPAGGTFVRDGSGRLTGVLLERAHEFVTAAAPEPSFDQMVEAILVAGDQMRAQGITCASDMMTGRWNLTTELDAYRRASELGCKVRLRLYAQWSAVFGPKGIGAEGLRARTADMDKASCKVAGIKIFADGAIGSGTAAMYEEYQTVGTGTLIYEPTRLMAMVKTAHDEGFSLAIHSIGDRATDLVMDAYQELDDASRHRIEHAMVLSDFQIERMAKIGCHCTMQPEFLVRFVHAYERQLGPFRARLIKRAKSVMAAGVPLSFSSDRPIVGGDPWDGIFCAEMRPEGFDPSENVSRESAIRNYTEMAGLANGDGAESAGLAGGAWADFQIYSENPLTAQRPVVQSSYLGGEPASNAQV